MYTDKILPFHKTKFHVYFCLIQLRTWFVVLGSESPELNHHSSDDLGDSNERTGNHQLYVTFYVSDRRNSGDAVSPWVHFVDDEIPQKKCRVEWVSERYGIWNDFMKKV